MDFLASSDTPLDVGGSPTTRPLDVAVDETGADGAASQAKPLLFYAATKILFQIGKSF